MASSWTTPPGYARLNGMRVLVAIMCSGFSAPVQAGPKAMPQAEATDVPQASAKSIPPGYRVVPADVTASSVLESRYNRFMENYHPRYVADDDPKTAWTEGGENAGEGEWIELDLGAVSDVRLLHLRIRNGYHKSKKLFRANSRARAITIELQPSGVTADTALESNMVWQDVAIAQPVGPVESVRVLVTSVYPGKVFSDLCISDVQVYVVATSPPDLGTEAEKQAALNGWMAERRASASAPWTAVTAGGEHSCGLKADGTAVCWGGNRRGQLEVPAGRFKELAAGSFHTCAIANDGTVACWGDDAEGQCTAPEDTFAHITAGSFHACGLKDDGTVRCWGRGDTNENCGASGGWYCGQLQVPDAKFTQIDAGAIHTCGVLTSGALACWGAAGQGQASPPAGQFVQVAAGAEHSCAVRQDQTVMCWGAGARAGNCAPEENEGAAFSCGQSAAPRGLFRDLTVGWEHSCAVDQRGRVTCWGYDRYGQASPPAAVINGIAAGGQHTCAITNTGGIRCWGQKRSGQLRPPPR